jgi:hypothetical protein
MKLPVLVKLQHSYLRPTLNPLYKQSHMDIEPATPYAMLEKLVPTIVVFVEV